MSSLLFMDGFDHYEASEADDFLVKWDFVNNLTGDESIIPGGRFGDGQCWYSYDAAAASTGQLGKTFTPMDRVVIVGMAIKFTGLYSSVAYSQGMIIINNSVNMVYPQMSLLFNSSRVPRAYRKTGALSYSLMFSGEALDTSTWYYIEMLARLHNTNGKCEVRIDGESIGTYEGDTRYDGSDQTNDIYIGCQRNNGDHAWIDDVYMASGEDFYGDSRIDCIYPVASGEVTELTAVGAPDNFECVSGEQFNDDVSGEWVQGAYGTDSYIFGNCGVSGEIYGIQLAHISNRTEPTGTLKSKNILRKGSVNYSGETHDETDDIEYKTACFDKDPSDDNSWSPAKVDACEFGVEFE